MQETSFALLERLAIVERNRVRAESAGLPRIAKRMEEQKEKLRAALRVQVEAEEAGQRILDKKGEGSTVKEKPEPPKAVVPPRNAFLSSLALDKE